MIPGDQRHIADDLIAYAREHNVTQIVFGKSARPRLFELINGSVVNDLVRRAGNISIHVVAGEEAASDERASVEARSASSRPVERAKTLQINYYPSWND